MVVLAACICSREGKTILLRQFVDSPRWKLEAYITEFPSLAESNSQHTTIEHKNVRFVYQTLESLYLVLVLSKDSNILLDMNLLNLFSQVLGQICASPNERAITQCAFEIIVAFDELVTAGYPENLNMFQVKTFLTMKSHEEEIQEIIAKNKEHEARMESSRRLKQMEMENRMRAAGGSGYSSRPHESLSPAAPVYNMASEGPSTSSSKPTTSFNKPPPKGMKLPSKKTMLS